MARRTSRNVPFASNPLLRVKLPAWRSQVVMLMVAVAFVALAARAVWLQVFTQNFLQKQGEMRYAKTLELPASRGKIFDRNGVVLASSLPARAVWAIPEHVEATPQQIASLAKLLDTSERELRRKLAEEDRSFVYLKRQVDAAVAERVAALRIPGIHQQREYKRYYPQGETLAHVVGFTNVEDIGQEGVELARNPDLAGRPGSRRVIRDRLGQVIEDVGAVREPHNGNDLALSIDSKIQFLAFDALRDAVQANKAKAGAAVVLDARTGEVLALANWPTYNPNQRGQLSGAQLRNRAITDTFEPGSTMKPFTIALALELGEVTPGTVIQTAPGRLTIGPNTIGDAHAHGPLTVEQIVQKSSNVGTAKIALGMPAQKMWEMYAELGFGQPPRIGFPGAVAGRVRPYRSWRPIEQATMSYGYGLSVSLLQLARAYTVFANDGAVLPVTLVKREAGEPVVGQRVFSPETARTVRDMLQAAAGVGGTAPKAQVAGYSVGGKSGTAHKNVEGGKGYVNKYRSWFVGLAPIRDPRIVVAVMVDEPSKGVYYGGAVAAPVFSQVVGQTLRWMGVPSDLDVNLQAAAMNSGEAAVLESF